MKLYNGIAAFALIVSPAAFADVITCVQTEPFITEVFDLDAGVATIRNDRNQAPAPTVINGIRLSIAGPAELEILGPDGAILRALTVDYTGADGMSDYIYPMNGGDGENGPVGCFTNRLPRLEPELR